MKHSIDESDFCKGPICPFASYYQFFREMMFALTKEGTFVLLHDERNPIFLRNALDGKSQEGLWPFLLQSIPQNKKANIGSISVQEIVGSIENSSNRSDWIIEFKKKYGIV